MFKKENLLLILIILLAFFWRFFNYENRWTLNQDQARDAVIALYTIQNHQLPLLGPPSSAGPFSFGPLYYFVIIIFTLILPGLVNGPWIGFTLLSVFSVYIFYLVGKRFADVRLGLIIAAIAAGASQSVFNAPDMLNPMLIGLTTASAFLFLDSPIWLGFFVGFSINLHLQAVGLLFLPISALIIKKESLVKKVRYKLRVLMGLLLAFIPLLYFDLTHNWAWSKSILDYLLVGQNKFHEIHSLIKDLIVFWPQFFGTVVSNNPSFGYFLILIICFAGFLVFKKQIRLEASFKVIILTLIVQIVILKFYKGPRLAEYLIVYQPFVIFLTGWAVWVVWKAHRFIGLAILVVILAVSSLADWKIVNTNTQNSLIFQLKSQVDQAVPGKKMIYSYADSNTTSLPLFYLWLKQGQIADNGTKIGVCIHSIVRADSLADYIENCPGEAYLLTSIDDKYVFNLNSASAEDLKKITQLNSQLIYNWLYDNYRQK